jgi:hypothetical protein
MRYFVSSGIITNYKGTYPDSKSLIAANPTIVFTSRMDKIRGLISLFGMRRHVTCHTRRLSRCLARILRHVVLFPGM